MVAVIDPVARAVRRRVRAARLQTGGRGRPATIVIGVTGVIAVIDRIAVTEETVVTGETDRRAHR